MDIANIYAKQIGDESYTIADCMEYSEELKQTMVAVDKVKMKATWIFSACGIIE